MKIQSLLYGALLLFAVGCQSETDGEEEAGESEPQSSVDSTPDEPVDNELLQALRTEVEERGLQAIEEQPQDEALVELGHNLFFDPILSGPKDANCAFCHQMDEATADEFPLSAGTASVRDENGDRRPGPQHRFTPRISPELFNRGHEDWRTMFWDTRVQLLDDGRVAFFDTSYAKIDDLHYRIMPDEADNLLAAQNMLPTQDRDEMRGFNSSRTIFDEHNELGSVADHSLEGTWNRLRDRILAIDEYRELLQAAYPEKDIDEDLHWAHATNGLAAFIIDSFTLTESPWDQFLRGDDQALTAAQIRGGNLFYGEAGCASCHGGDLFTDQEIYNWAVPPMTRGPEPFDNMDLGAAHRSHVGLDQAFHFRTPPLRNVELTGPYMHNGSLGTLEDVIRHKMDPVEGLWNYEPTHLGPVFRRQVHTGEEQLARVEKTLSPQALLTPELSDDQIDDLIAFMESLTDPRAADLTHLQRDEVASGLPIPDPKARPFRDSMN